MKKTISLILSLVLCLCSVSVLAETVDAVASASVADFYSEFAITGDDLMDALNSYSGFYTVTTVNEDGTPQVGYYIYGCLKYNDKYYLTMGIAPNQTYNNLVANGEGIAVYAASPSGDTPYAVAGARMWFKVVTDEETLAALTELYGADYAPFFCEVTAVRSLG